MVKFLFKQIQNQIISDLPTQSIRYWAYRTTSIINRNLFKTGLVVLVPTLDNKCYKLHHITGRCINIQLKTVLILRAFGLKYRPYFAAYQLSCRF